MIQPTPDGIVLAVRVIPRARTSGLDGTRGDALIVRLRSAPVEGAANEELIEVIAAALAVPRRAVSIASGGRSRRKRVHVIGIDATTAGLRLASAERR